MFHQHRKRMWKSYPLQNVINHTKYQIGRPGNNIFYHNPYFSNNRQYDHISKYCFIMHSFDHYLYLISNVQTKSILSFMFECNVYVGTWYFNLLFCWYIIQILYLTNIHIRPDRVIGNRPIYLRQLVYSKKTDSGETFVRELSIPILQIAP